MLKWLCTLSTLTPSTPMSSALGVVITLSGKGTMVTDYTVLKTVGNS